MRFVRKFSKGCLAFLLAVILLCPAAMAASPSYVDVPPGNPYYDAVAYMTDQGYSHGVGGSYFGVDQPITIKQFCVFLVRAFGNEQDVLRLENSETFWQTAIDICREKQWATGYVNPADLEPDMKLCRYSLYEMALQAVGYTIFSEEFYEDDVFCQSLRPAFYLGLTENPNGFEIATRGEAAKLIYSLKINPIPEQFLPSVTTKIPIENEYGTYDNSFLRQVAKLPDKVCKTFTENGWTMVFGTKDINEYNDKNEASAIGLTKSGRKMCYAATANSILHEVGHAMHFTIMKDAAGEAKLQSIYEAEKDGLVKLIREYAGESKYEAYAEAFTFYITWHNSAEYMMRLQQAAPRMYELLESQQWFS